MGILPWSCGFLLIMTVLSWAFFGRMTEETLVTRSLLNVLNNQAELLTGTISAKSETAYREECKRRGITLGDEDEEVEEEGETAPIAKNKNRKAKHRLTSKLHVRSLFSNEDQAQKTTQEYIFRNLLKTLYGSVPLCTPRGDNDPYVQQIFDEVRAKALELGAKLPMHKAQYLANIELSGPYKSANQFALFLILKGGKGEVFPRSPCTVHSLLDYINMNQRETCINIYLAPAPLLKALFGDDDVVVQICQRRQELHRRAIKDEDSLISPIQGAKESDILDVLSEEFKAQFASCLPSEIDPQFVEFRVSRTKPKDFPEPLKRNCKNQED